MSRQRGTAFGPAMAGSPLLLDSLAPATRRAWLAAGAALDGQTPASRVHNLTGKYI